MKKLITFLMMAFAVLMVSCAEEVTPDPTDDSTPTVPKAWMSVKPAKDTVISLGTDADVLVTVSGTAVTLKGEAIEDTIGNIGTAVNAVIGDVRTISVQTEVDAYIATLKDVVIITATPDDAKITQVEVVAAMNNTGDVTARLKFTVKNDTTIETYEYTFTTAASDPVKLSNAQMELTDLNGINVMILNTAKRDIYSDKAASTKLIHDSGGDFINGDRFTSIGTGGFITPSVTLTDIVADPEPRFLYVDYTEILKDFNRLVQPKDVDIDGVIPSAAFSVEWTAKIEYNYMLVLTGKPTPKTGYDLPKADTKYTVQIELAVAGRIKDYWTLKQ